jgi:hypothetical protein
MGELHLLATCAHHSKLQVTAQSLISTLYKSPPHPPSLFAACCVFNSRFLATALTIYILQLPALTSLLLGDYPEAELFSAVNSTIPPSFLSFPFRARLNSQPSPKLSLTSQLLHFTSLHFTSLPSTKLHSESELLYDGRFNASHFPLKLTTSNSIFQLNTCG